jgi:hypothetical protein
MFASKFDSTFDSTLLIAVADFDCDLRSVDNFEHVSKSVDNQASSHGSWYTPATKVGHRYPTLGRRPLPTSRRLTKPNPRRPTSPRVPPRPNLMSKSPEADGDLVWRGVDGGWWLPWRVC